MIQLETRDTDIRTVTEDHSDIHIEVADNNVARTGTVIDNGHIHEGEYVVIYKNKVVANFMGDESGMMKASNFAIGFMGGLEYQ